MPFTFAHPAAVLPLLRFCPRYLNLAALAIGSMVPDLGYYAHNWVWSMRGHSFSGVVQFDVPAGLCLLVSLYLSARPVAELLPSPHKEVVLRLAPPLVIPSLRAIIVAVLSIIAGACTHIIWDGFTHANGWCVREFSALTPTVFSIGSYAITVWQLLQHASTVLGIALIAYAYAKYARSLPVASHERSAMVSAVWLFCLLLPAGVATLSSLWAFRTGFNVPNFDNFVFNSVVTFVGIFFPLTVVAGTLILSARFIAAKAGASLDMMAQVVQQHAQPESAAVEKAGSTSP